MLGRCERPQVKAYASYGRRGIEVCAEWHDVARFIRDVEWLIGPRPDDMTPSGKRHEYQLDRIDNDWHYEPLNVRWATSWENNNNRRPEYDHDLAPCLVCGVPTYSRFGICERTPECNAARRRAQVSEHREQVAA
jgi:hypothetical protein